MDTMSRSVVEQIIGKMLLDIEFRNLMASDRDKALEGFDLTDEEREGLKNVDFDDFSKVATSLDERMNKWWGGMGVLIWRGGW
jgi:hypothetical protein